MKRLLIWLALAVIIGAVGFLAASNQSLFHRPLRIQLWSTMMSMKAAQTPSQLEAIRQQDLKNVLNELQESMESLCNDRCTVVGPNDEWDVRMQVDWTFWGNGTAWGKVRLTNLSGQAIWGEDTTGGRDNIVNYVSNETISRLRLIQYGPHQDAILK